MNPEQLWVVAYDSPNTKRRRKLAKLLEGYGERLQLSVFECRLQAISCSGSGKDWPASPPPTTAFVCGVCRNGPKLLSNWAGRWSPRSGKTR